MQDSNAVITYILTGQKYWVRTTSEVHSLFTLHWDSYSFLSQPEEFPWIAQGPPGQSCNATTTSSYGCAALLPFLQSSFVKHFAKILCHHSPGQKLSVEPRAKLSFEGCASSLPGSGCCAPWTEAEKSPGLGNQGTTWSLGIRILASFKHRQCIHLCVLHPLPRFPHPSTQQVGATHMDYISCILLPVKSLFPSNFCLWLNYIRAKGCWL